MQCLARRFSKHHLRNTCFSFSLLHYCALYSSLENWYGSRLFSGLIVRTEGLFELHSVWWQSESSGQEPLTPRSQYGKVETSYKAKNIECILRFKFYTFQQQGSSKCFTSWNNFYHPKCLCSIRFTGSVCTLSSPYHLVYITTPLELVIDVIGEYEVVHNCEIIGQLCLLLHFFCFCFFTNAVCLLQLQSNHICLQLQ